MLAKAIIMKGESLDVFCDFIRSLEEAFRPQGAIENALIEKMAISQWRQMRLMSLERSGMHCKNGQHEQARPAAAYASRVRLDSPRSLHQLARRGRSGR